jgi:hypothetical protein
VKAGWDGICLQFFAPVVEEEAVDVRLRIEEKKNRKPSKTHQVERVAVRRSEMVDPLQSELGSKVWPWNQSKSIFKGRTSRRTSTPAAL